MELSTTQQVDEIGRVFQLQGVPRRFGDIVLICKSKLFRDGYVTQDAIESEIEVFFPDLDKKNLYRIQTLLLGKVVSQLDVHRLESTFSQEVFYIENVKENTK
jgi:hypothetical protein